jgi:hypothetical protein
MVRLFGASGATRKATIRWNCPRPSAVFRSDTSQRRCVKLDGPIEIPGWGLITLRAEFETAIKSPGIVTADHNKLAIHYTDK